MKPGKKRIAVLHFSLGNAAAPCVFTVSSVKVEKAGGTSTVSDAVYTF